MTCYTGGKGNHTTVTSHLNSFWFHIISIPSRNILPAFLLFLCFIPLVYFFQNLRLSLPRALKTALGSVIQAWYRNCREGTRCKCNSLHILALQLKRLRTYFYRLVKMCISNLEKVIDIKFKFIPLFSSNHLNNNTPKCINKSILCLKGWSRKETLKQNDLCSTITTIKRNHEQSFQQSESLVHAKSLRIKLHAKGQRVSIPVHVWCSSRYTVGQTWMCA